MNKLILLLLFSLWALVACRSGKTVMTNKKDNDSISINILNKDTISNNPDRYWAIAVEAKIKTLTRDTVFIASVAYDSVDGHKVKIERTVVYVTNPITQEKIITIEPKETFLPTDEEIKKKKDFIETLKTKHEASGNEFNQIPYHYTLIDSIPEALARISPDVVLYYGRPSITGQGNGKELFAYKDDTKMMLPAGLNNLIPNDKQIPLNEQLAAFFSLNDPVFKNFKIIEITNEKKIIENQYDLFNYKVNALINEIPFTLYVSFYNNRMRFIYGYRENGLVFDYDLR